MTRVRTDGLILISLGAVVILVTLALALRLNTRGAALDFLPDYYSARTLINGGDPYNEIAVLRTYRTEGGARDLSDPLDRAVATRYVYPPSAFAVMVPSALLPWGFAHGLWAILSVSSLILAGCLAWDLAGSNGSVLCAALVAYLLANSEILVVLSNPSELAIGLCVIAVWCFLRERYVAAGILCLALSLAVKPQDSGLIWLYFFLAGGTFRKRALQTLLVCAAVSAPFVFWVYMASPHWVHELQSNLLAFSMRGGLNDPGPASKEAHQFVDLQVIISRFCDRPAVYNLVSYLIFAPLFVIWARITIRTRASAEKAAFALAAIAPLSLLPIHHHVYDAKLILLVIPVLALLLDQRDRTSRTALALTAIAVFLTGDISGWLITKAALSIQSAPGGVTEWLTNALAVFPAPLILLATSAFYLRVYYRSTLPQPGRLGREVLSRSSH
jgi:hypothetical protein